jgi:membrane-associated PAP2 superfamily phosphatase
MAQIEKHASIENNSPLAPLYRRYWLPDLIVIVSLMGITIWLFTQTEIDFIVSDWFHLPEVPPGEAWPYSRLTIWRLVNNSDIWLVGLLSFGALSALVLARFKSRYKRLKIYAIFILLSMIIGPGILVNCVFKAHLDRPRPRHVIEYGGKQSYVRPLYKGTEGKSFPSGHASVGFCYVVFWFIWRRRPGRAFWAMLGAVALGSVLGIARLTAGAHFLSDILWAFYIPFFTSLVLYHFVLRIPQYEDAPITQKLIFRNRSTLELSCYGVLGGGILFWLILGIILS